MEVHNAALWDASLELQKVARKPLCMGRGRCQRRKMVDFSGGPQERIQLTLLKIKQTILDTPWESRVGQEPEKET